MADLPYLHHGYFPRGRTKQLPWVTKSTAPGIPFETSSNPATRAEETNLLLEKQQPVKELATLLRKLRIPREAQTILGNSSIAVVSLERLNVQTLVLSSSLQPVVSLERLPHQTEPQICCNTSPDQQNSFRPETSLKTPELSDLDGAAILWTEPYSDGSTSEEREHDSGFDCESIPDQPYILYDSGSDHWDPEDRTGSEKFYLDPDPEQSVVIQLDPELQTDPDPDAEAEVKGDVDVVQEDDSEDQRLEELLLSTDLSGYVPDMEELVHPGSEEVDGLEHEELDHPGPEELEGPDLEELDHSEPEELEGPDHWELDHSEPEELEGPDYWELDQPGPEELEGPDHEELNHSEPEELEGPDHEELDHPGPEELEGPDREELDHPGPEELEGPDHKDHKELDGGTKPDSWTEVDSDDFCAVCLVGGDLLCCDRCPKVFHLSCHLPPLTSFPQGDWVCSLCRTDQDPVDAYEGENVHSCRGAKAPYTLSNQEQRRCEKLALQLYSHALSAPFHEPVSPLALNYYQIIRRPIDLSVIRRKLDRTNTLHYFSVEQFIDDVLLMFRNCATFNYPDSEVAQAGQNLEKVFLNQLKEVFPDRTFPKAHLEMMNRARLRWLRKKKERHKRRRCSLRAHKYYLM